MFKVNLIFYFRNDVNQHDWAGINDSPGLRSNLMKKFLVYLILPLAILAAQAEGAEEIQTASYKSELKILYAGLPNTDRTKDFMDFLSKYFSKVEFTNYSTFNEKKTTGFDVIILDYDGTTFNPPIPQISLSYCRSTVTMGVPGAFICSRLSLKTSYL